MGRVGPDRWGGVGGNGADVGSSLAGHVRHHRHRQSATDAADTRRRGTVRADSTGARRDLRRACRRGRRRSARSRCRRAAARSARRARAGRPRRPRRGDHWPSASTVSTRSASDIERRPRRQRRRSRRRCARARQRRADRSQGCAVDDPPRPAAHGPRGREPSPGATPSPSSLGGYLVVQQAFSAIDRLEVRGRDSAGLHVFVWGHDIAADALAALRRRSRHRPTVPVGFGRVGRRRRCRSCTRPPPRSVSSATTPPRCARRSHADALLRRALQSPGARVALLGHTRWASVGIISEPNTHPLNSFELEQPGGAAGAVRRRCAQR